MTDLERAIIMATEAHRQQVDKTGQPYILHPLRVMLAVGEGARIAAVLHDVVEDGGVKLSEIWEWFGDDVHDAVTALTRGIDESYEDFILRAKANPIAREVKFADVIDNLRPGAEHLRPRYEKALAVLLAD